MKTSELIKRLKEIQEQIGDSEIEIYMEDIDGTECGMDSINEVEISTNESGENPSVYIAHRIDKE